MRKPDLRGREYGDDEEDDCAKDSDARNDI